MGARTVAVVTADFIESRLYAAPDRRRLSKLLQRVFQKAQLTFPDSVLTEIGFRVSAGDEFQFVLKDPATALPFVLYLRSAMALEALRPIVRFRAAIGVGTAVVSTPRGQLSSPYEWDGPAFVKARDGIETLKGKRGFVRWTAIASDDAKWDRAINTVVGFQDYMQQAWTVSQWEAVHWALRGFKGTEIAARIKIRHQNVSKRLSAAGWPVFESGLDFVRESMTTK